MEKNTITFNGVSIETFSEPNPNRIISLLSRQRKLTYFDNPPVAALVNGELTSLMDNIMQHADIVTIPLFSPLGRRVYRKTLCFVLCTASARLYPERSLVIGHSLGDGYFFSYKGGEKADVEKLKNKMAEIIADDEIIDFIRLSFDEALRYVREHNLKDTELLLLSRNDGSYRFNGLGSTLEMYYEPMLPSTRYLAIWDLVEYHDGILLRYPQSRNEKELMPFFDNKLLFSVFKENKKNSELLHLESLGRLNNIQITGNIQQTVTLSETLQRRQFAEVGRTIADRGNKVVFIAGPSASGKTTASLKLCNELKINGLNPIKISLDDYYKKLEDVPLDASGNKNFEVLDALDLPLFRNQLNGLLKGEEVYLATYSIKTRQHDFSTKPTKLSEDDVLIIEGIHGLNPALVPEINPNKIFKIYISALNQLNLDSRSRISTTDNRILRRLVRDYRTRGLDAVETLSRWPSVERGEKDNIFPYQNNADIIFNSALDYEFGVLTTYATPLLRSVTKNDGMAYTTARRLLSFLKLVYPIPSEYVPSDSILREFIGGSIFNAT